MISTLWPKAKSFRVGLFSDIQLYYHALSIGLSTDKLTVKILLEYLPTRVVGVSYIQGVGPQTAQDLLVELKLLGYINADNQPGYKVITKEGERLVFLYQKDYNAYLLEIARKLSETYIIPGWFVNRLWQLNPEGQGQLVIPSPLPDWQSKRYVDAPYHWNSEIEEVSRATVEKINKVLPGSLPVNLENWITDVGKEYNRLGKRATELINNNENNVKSYKYSQRQILTLCMKTTTIKHLFSNKSPVTQKNDFPVRKEPLNSVRFTIWCTRLDILEFIFFTDFHSDISGRLMVPTSVFRNSDANAKFFKKLDFVKSNQPTSHFYLFQPKWEVYKNDFLYSLYATYQQLYNRYQSIYVPLQQLRDEACRVMRLSAKHFELLLEYSYKESVERKITLAISLETDIPRNQKGKFKRRPVFVNGRAIFLIAIKPLL